MMDHILLSYWEYYIETESDSHGGEYANMLATYSIDHAIVDNDSYKKFL